MAERRRTAIGHRRNLSAVQRQAVRHDIDAVRVRVRLLNVIAEGQRPRARTVQIAGGPERPADIERDRGRAAGLVHGHLPVKTNRDLDGLARRVDGCVAAGRLRRERHLNHLRPRHHTDIDAGGSGNAAPACDRESEGMRPVSAGAVKAGRGEFSVVPSV